MTAKLFIHILFPVELKPDDLTIIHPATSAQPGQARLIKASTGAARPNAPNSLPLKSRSGATVGYVANIELMEKPYNDSYVIT